MYKKSLDLEYEIYDIVTNEIKSIVTTRFNVYWLLIRMKWNRGCKARVRKTCDIALQRQWLESIK